MYFQVCQGNLVVERKNFKIGDIILLNGNKVVW